MLAELEQINGCVPFTVIFTLADILIVTLFLSQTILYLIYRMTKLCFIHALLKVETDMIILVFDGNFNKTKSFLFAVSARRGVFMEK